MKINFETISYDSALSESPMLLLPPFIHFDSKFVVLISTILIAHFCTTLIELVCRALRQEAFLPEKR